MADKFGEIQAVDTDIYEEREIEWKIKNFSSLINSAEIYFNSPDFSFADSSWYLQLEYKYFERPNDVNLLLIPKKGTEYSVKYDYGVKRLDDRVERLARGIFNEVGSSYSKVDVIKLMTESEFKRRQSELVVSNVLTLTCSLKRRSPLFPQPSVLDRSKHKKLIKLDTLSKNLKDVFDNKENCDTILRVLDKEYEVHKFVLMARSSVFAAMFKHDTKEKQTGVIDIPDCDPDSFGEFLEYLYCGKLEEPSSDSTLHLYETSDKYDVLELKEFCVEYLMENLTVENSIKVVIMADKYDEKELFVAAQKFFIKNLSKLLETPEWERLLKNEPRLVTKLLKEVAKEINVK